MEQGQGSKEGVGVMECCVSPEIHLWLHSLVRSSFCSTVRRRGTNFAVTHLICKSSVRIFWHVPNAILTSSATSLIVRHWSARMISRTRATVSSVWEVDGLHGQGHLQRISIHFWNGNTIKMSSTDLDRTLQKLLAAFHMFQYQLSPDANRNWWTHTAVLSRPSRNVTHRGRRSVEV
jgi:hypothetical protein